MNTPRPKTQLGWQGILRAVFALALVFWLGACGNDPNPAPLGKTHADGTPWKVRFMALPDDPRSFDPQVAYDQMSRRVLEPIIETLVEYDPFKTDPYEVQPVLLEKLPEHEVNADGTVTYHCALKEKIFFIDDPCFPGGKGRELVAGDVRYAFQRLSDPRWASPIYSALADYIAGMSEGYEAAKKPGAVFDYAKPFRGIEVLDAHHFNLHLLKPYPQIIYWLSMHFTAPVAREAVEFYDGKVHADSVSGRMAVRPKFEWHPVSTGPFKLVEYTPASRIRMVRNEGYSTMRFPDGGWPREKEELLRPLVGKQLPLVDEAIFTIFREALPIWLLTRQGYLDAMAVTKDAFNSVVTVSKEMSPKFASRGMHLEKDVEPSTYFISFNMQDPVLGKNKKLRQALSSAFDALGETEIFYNGVPLVAQQIVPPGIFGHQSDFKNPYGFNLELAHRLLAEAGYPNGRDPKTGQPLELTMDCQATGALERQQAEFHQRQFEQLGIRVRVIENTFARMLEKEDQGNFQMASGTGWGADYPDPENFLFLFYSKNFPPEGKNISRFKSERFDALFEKMATMENTQERLEIVREMNAILAEECPMTLTFHKAFYTLVQPFAQRTHNNPMLEGAIKYSTLDYPLREEKRREWNPVPKWPIGAALLLVAGALGYAVRWNRRHDV